MLAKKACASSARPHNGSMSPLPRKRPNNNYNIKAAPACLHKDTNLSHCWKSFISIRIYADNTESRQTKYQCVHCRQIVDEIPKAES